VVALEEAFEGLHGLHQLFLNGAENVREISQQLVASTAASSHWDEEEERA